MHTIDWNHDYTIGLVKTDDPRVFGVLRRDDLDYRNPDGDAYAPTFALSSDYYEEWTATRYDSTYMDDEAERNVQRIIDARFHFQQAGIPWETVARYARIFLDTTFEVVSSSVHRDYPVIILNTPAWREHIGITGADQGQEHHPRILHGDRDTWQAYLDGDVFGIGAYVDLARTDHDAPTPDHDEAWDDVRDDSVTWDYYGDAYAAAEAHATATWVAGTLPDLRSSGATPRHPMLF